MKKRKEKAETQREQKFSSFCWSDTNFHNFHQLLGPLEPGLSLITSCGKKEEGEGGSFDKIQ